MELKIYDSLPDGFLNVKPNEIGSVLSGPSLIRIRGKEEPPLFITTLLHGNEPTGFLAVQKIFKKYLHGESLLPRSVTLFIGNVKAAEKNVRFLPDQQDYNRIWNGGTLPEHRLAEQVIATVKQRGYFASIDIHNTSGENPHYACIHRLNAPAINLGRLFSNTLVYFVKPSEVIALAFGDLAPSITIESGKPNDPYGVPHVFNYLDTCLNLRGIPKEMDKEEPKIYHSIVRIRLPKNSHADFTNDTNNADFRFPENLDSMNFSELPENTLLGWRLNPQVKLSVLDENDREVGDEFICYDEKEIRLKRAVVPSNFTTDEKIIHQDCLGYLMQRFALT